MSTFSNYISRLTGLYDEREAKAVMRLLLEEAFGLTYTDIVCGAIDSLPEAESQRLETMVSRLAAGEPVQHVIGHGYFYGRPFIVNSHVLVPRPETELLCREAISNAATSTVLDIGTGSGCIAITIAAECPESHVTAWDISPDALDVARRNAAALGVSVAFEQHDILDVEACCSYVQRSGLQYDVIVSNPPYICDVERQSMDANVLGHDPDLALYVPDEDPLLFYRAILLFAQQALTPGGMIVFELNNLYAEDTAQLATQMGFVNAHLLDDQFGRKRFLRVFSKK